MKLNIYELYNFSDGNDDILSDIGNTDEIRNGMWALTPYGTDDSALNETDVPPVVIYSNGDADYGQKLADLLADKVGLPKPLYINSGSFGHAFRIGNELVLKITSSPAEATAAVKILQKGTPKYLVAIYDVYKIVDTENNIALFAIVEDYIPDRPKPLFDSYANIIDKIMPGGLNSFDVFRMIRKNFDHNQVNEIAEKILTDNPEANISERDRRLVYKYILDLSNIRQELIDFDIKSDDYLNTDNLGYKNGVLRFFDVGGTLRGTEPTIPQRDVVFLPENAEVINEDYNRKLADELANRIAEIKGFEKPRFIGSGTLGVAYDIGNDKVLKITKDNSEAAENLTLIGKPLKYIAQPYNVFKVTPQNNELSGNSLNETYAIILEKLQTNAEEFKRLYDRIDYAFSQIMNVRFEDVIEFYLHGNNMYDIDKNKIEKYFSKNPQDAEYFYSILRIAEEAENYGIESRDYYNPENLGYKKSGVIGFFDVGFGNFLFKPQNVEKINVGEDGSSKFSTDDALGQDEFPVYNQNDTSPLTNNNIPTTVDEDLEYNHVDDATEDEYIMTERKLSYMPGAETVSVKKKCRLGGLGNTSVACNQGDINNLDLKKLDENIDYDTLNRGVGKDEMISIPDFPLKDLRVSKRGIAGAIQDIKQGRPSQTDEPVLVFYNISNKTFLVEDGYHRVAQAYLNKETTIPVNIYSDMWSDYVANIGDENRFVLGEAMNGQKYYRAVEKNMGETVQFEPEGYYEAIDDDGNPVIKYDTFWISETPEIAASYSVGGAVLGLYSMFLQYGKNPNVFYIYEINEKPDVDISHWDTGDFGQLQEVRYRRAVQGTYVGKVTITDDMRQKLNAYYEMISSDEYDSPIYDPEYEKAMKIAQDTDYDQYLAGVKDMVNENVNIDLPNKLSGFNSFKIINDGQTVGEVEIVDRGIQGKNHYITVDKIYIYKGFRGQGFGNDAMKIILEYADKNNLIITLTPDNVWGASVSKLKDWYKSLGFTFNRGKNKDFQTMQLMYRLPKGMSLNEGNYAGKAYRVDSGFWHERGKTAGDVVRFERDELENVDDFAHITDEKLAELDKYPAKSIVWVTKTFEDAKRYSNEPDFSDIDEFDLNGEVIGEDGDGGYLVLIKNNNLNEIYTGLGVLKNLLNGKRNVDWVTLDKNNMNKVQKYKLGVIPVRMQGGNAIKCIIYNDKGKNDAHWLYQIVKKNNHSLSDSSPEEAQEIGRILGHSQATIDEYIRRKYGTRDLNEGQISSLQDLPFKKDVEERGGKVYSVGGAVRDEFLGKESKDLDVLITGIPMDELEQILSKYGRVDAVGKSFGILKFRAQGGDEIDIAIPRTETVKSEEEYNDEIRTLKQEYENYLSAVTPETSKEEYWKKADDFNNKLQQLQKDKLNAHKAFAIKSDHALPIEKDLERRDFTINAIAKDSDGNIVDPFKGQEDLKNKTIRIVNPEAFSDDPLRMLRAVQFASRFGFTIEPETMKMIRDNASRIKEIPAERILTEFDKIIKKGDMLTGAQLLKDTGLFAQIFGFDIKQSTINRSSFDDVKTMGEFIFLLTRLLPNPAEFYKNSLKGDVDTYKEIKALQMAFDSAEATNLIEARAIASNMYLTSPQTLQSSILPSVIETAAQELLQGKYPKSVNELAVNGNDLMQLGLKGKEIGDMLKSLLLKIYSNKITNNKEELLNIVKKNTGQLDEIYLSPTDTILHNMERVKVRYLVKKYDEWNYANKHYSDPTRETVHEFLKEKYPDILFDKKLSEALYFELIDRELLNEN